MGFRAAALAALLICAHARAADFTVHRVMAADEKAVFATIESPHVVPARVRTGGTIAAIAVHRGEEVKAGQILATVGDPKLVLEERALTAEVAALRAQLAQNEADLKRTETLSAVGAAPRVLRDQLRTQVQVQGSTIAARMARLAAVAQQLLEGQVLAPADGRILDIPFTEGTVVVGGEQVASIAEAGYVLRLLVPEEHARFLKAGDPVRVDVADLAGGGAAGTISLVYPLIQDGRVMADAQVPGLGGYFVGTRVRVWVSGGMRARMVVPAHLLVTRFGLDYAPLRDASGVVEVPVQRGQPAPSADMPDGIEILSGLADGDALAAP